MKLCLDVGNSHIFGGVFSGKEIKLRFRYETKAVSTSDQLGLFLRAVLRENGIDYSEIQHIAVSSVVPSLDYSLGSACIKYFDKEPFMLQAGVKTGLKIKTSHPAEVGSDLIAASIAALHQFPKKDLIIVDFGTATTYTAVNAEKEFLGVVIQAGVRTSMSALQQNTAKLPSVRIVKPETTLGRHTIACIQSGLYYGQLGAMREIVKNISTEVFAGKTPIIIGAGGFASLFESESIFTLIEPDLVLHGIRLALEVNT